MAAILNSIKAFIDGLLNRGFAMLDKVFPPEKRSEILLKLQAFAVNNPKLSAFLLAQFALTGFPLVLFATFTITVFLFALIVALLIGLLAAVLFTVLMAGTALILVLPTIFMTTFAASFLWVWGMGGYYLVKWFNEGDSPAKQGEAIGDKLNSMTGGTMGSFLMEPMRQKEDDKAQDEKMKTVHGGLGAKPEKDEQSNGRSRESSPSSAGAAKGVDGVTQHADGAQSKAATGAGAAKGAAGGTTEVT